LGTAATHNTKADTTIEGQLPVPASAMFNCSCLALPGLVHRNLWDMQHPARQHDKTVHKAATAYPHLVHCL
jgi:hypothetical protein